MNIYYDERHDILHVFLGSPINAFADEEFPGIYVSRYEHKKPHYDFKSQWLKTYTMNINSNKIEHITNTFTAEFLLIDTYL